MRRLIFIVFLFLSPSLFSQGIADYDAVRVRSYFIYNNDSNRTASTADSILGFIGGSDTATLIPIPSGVTINNNTNNYVLTATGKQDTIQGESEFIYSGGNCSISSETAASFVLNYYTATGGNYSQLVLGKYNGTKGSYDALDDNDCLGAVNFAGSESSSFSLAVASIQVQATEDWTTSANGVEMKFKTTGNGEASSSTRMMLDDEINLQANTYLDDATLYHAINTIGNGDATPDVSAGNVWCYTTALTTVTVTDLDNPTPGAFYIIVGGSDTQTLTINDSGNFYLTGNITLGANDVIVLFCVADNRYIEISRSDN